ncbi:hypothetical protein M231_02081 [Tremella mesenterica]|uniref:K Homology domain-containing protein n=1 Tax=Tremella mesenterica TaxID=5217 RepID=A0A4Q1BRN2_TREME|nr:hypothetical protein M231_02081 [Tremella mesenterica]
MDSYTTSFVILRSGQSHNNIIPLSRSLSQSISLAPETLSHPPSLSASQSSTRDSSNTNPSIISSSNAQEEKDWKLVQTLSREIGNREGCTITVTKEFIQERLGSTYSLDLLDSNISNAPLCTAYNFVLSGPQPSVLAARGALLRQCPRDDRAALSVTRVDFLIDPLVSSSNVKAPVEKKLRDIVNLSRAHIYIVNSHERIDAGVEGDVLLSLVPPFHKEQHSPDVDSRHSSTAQSITLSNESSPSSRDPHGKDGNSADSVPSKPKTISDSKETVTYGLESERMCDVIITSNMENVEVAKVRVLVLQDELSGMHVESCDIDYKLHGIVSGRKRSTIQAIQENTGTNIYFPTKLVGVLNPPSSGSPPDPTYRPMNMILITGEFFNVQRAKDMLLQAAAQKSHLVISRDTVILPRKLDWLLIERVDELRKIMSDNGTYIQVPSVGTQRSLITVFGDHRNSIERTIRCLMAMASRFFLDSNYYLASVWLLPVSYDFITSLQPINALQMQPVLKNISQVTGAEVVFKNHCFEIYGLEYQVRSAVLMVLDLDVVKIFQCELRFQIELSVEHRDFLAGKKNGKINKIMKSANVKIRFETCNDYNFLIDITGGVPGALQGLSLLQMELPAEMSFYIPEKHHKRIIGAGGKNIQQIMRTYGVYVKFSNNEEFNSLGGYVDNEDNVIARTPAKNAAQLNNLMGAITRFIIPKSEKDFISDSLIIPRKYHRALLGEKNIFLHDIEAKTNTHIEFPAKETGSDMVNIFGPESQIHIAAAMLLDHVPFEINLHVPPNPAFIPLIRGEKFTEFTSTIQRDHHILISASPLFSETDAIFKFQCLRSNIEFLPAARDSLEEFLSGHGIQVYPTPALRRADSFTDASFSQLNARLLARANSRSDLDLDDSEILMNRHHRVGSNADVRALFDGTNSTGVNSSGATGLVPTQVLVHPSQSHGHGTRFVSMDNTGNSGFVGAFSIPQRATEYWQPSSNPMKNPSQSDPSKRDSDPIIQDRLSQLTIHPTRHPGTAPRAASHRTQSLDITSLNFVRLQRVPLGDSTVQGGGPNTSTGQFFPLPSHQAMHGHGLNGFSVDAGLGDVSQGK